LASIYVVLLIPDRDPPAVHTAAERPFVWNRDAFWKSLETRFEEARAAGCPALAPRIDALEGAIEPQLHRLEVEHLTPGDPSLESLETSLFELTPLVAACPERLSEYLSTIARLRQGIKRQSQAWDMSTLSARDALYRVLYGSRAALEEVLLQVPRGSAPELLLGTDEPSATPALEVHGVRLHSGDVLVSRGGAPTSALIARGHDFPGNFSHIALLHVDEATGTGSLIEAHSECGVAIATMDEYLGDLKLRILALRPRADLKELLADPQLPHRVASEALRAARAHHIPYDFTMDPREHSALFCSEVASAAYERFGVDLWPGLSNISSPGVASWLAAFGVRNFEFQEPSDLEYDPKLRVVAEWRNPEALFQDHLDNAVVDVRLEEAEKGIGLGYDRLMLPIARILKGWSLILNACGRVGRVPEGMSATAALRNQRFCREHDAIRERLLARASEFERERGYRAPYPELMLLARKALSQAR
jgi:hypothetical protein